MDQHPDTDAAEISEDEDDKAANSHSKDDETTGVDNSHDEGAALSDETALEEEGTQSKLAQEMDRKYGASQYSPGLRPRLWFDTLQCQNISQILHRLICKPITIPMR